MEINTQLIKDLYPMDRYLLGSGYDTALKYIGQLIDLDIIEILSGTKCWTWTVPQEWIIKDAWIKHNGKKVLDFKKNSLSVIIGAEPIHKKIKLKELKTRLHYDEDNPKATPYIHDYYEHEWGFCLPYKDYLKFDSKEYEIMIDSEYRDGTLKIGQHTIKGKSDKEVLIIVHLDHPYQANDGLSQVIMAVDLAKKIKVNHTIKILFVPETIGSITYCKTQDISKVDFVITADMIGNDASIILQRDYDKNRKLNLAAWLALLECDIKTKTHSKITEFRAVIGADEYVFSDPLINIPAVFFTRFQPRTQLNINDGYPQYHTSEDTPEIIKPKKIEEVRDVIIRTIEIMEQDWIPKRLFKGPLCRSKYKIQSPLKESNRQLDYLIYSIDGKQSVIQLAIMNHLDFNYTNEILTRLKKDKIICKV